MDIPSSSHILSTSIACPNISQKFLDEFSNKDQCMFLGFKVEPILFCAEVVRVVSFHVLASIHVVPHPIVFLVEAPSIEPCKSIGRHSDRVRAKGKGREFIQFTQLKCRSLKKHLSKNKLIIDRVSSLIHMFC